MLFISYKDIIEICFFSGICYYLFIWLKKDTQKPLLSYFYIFCCFLLCAFYLNLSTISWFLLNFSSAIVICFLILHQYTLQKNFIALHQITPAKAIQHSSGHWLNVLISSLLNSLNKGIESWCIIEQQNALDTFLNANILVTAPIQEQLLFLLLEQKNTPMILIDKNGYIKKSCFWNFHDPSVIVYADKLYQKAGLIVHHTDALIIHCIPNTHSFTLLYKKQHITDLSASGLLALLQKILISTQKNPIKNKKDVSSCAHL